MMKKSPRMKLIPESWKKKIPKMKFIPKSWRKKIPRMKFIPERWRKKITESRSKKTPGNLVWLKKSNFLKER